MAGPRGTGTTPAAVFSRATAGVVEGSGKWEPASARAALPGVVGCEQRTAHTASVGAARRAS